MELTLRVHGLLTSELLQHTRGAGEAIAGLSDAAVQDELVNLNLAHDILGLQVRGYVKAAPQCKRLQAGLPP